MPNLPQELLEYVIDSIAENSERDGRWLGADLFQFSRASRSVRHRCLVYIFSSIYIRGSNQAEWENRLIPLLKLIEARPAIAKWIQELVLSTTDVEVESHFDASFAQNKYRASFGHPLFKKLLQVISPIHKVSIKGRHVGGYRSLLHPATEPSYTSIIRRLPLLSPQNITSLSIEGLQQLSLSMLLNCYHLTSLELLEVQVGQVEEQPSVDGLEFGVPVFQIAPMHLTIAHTTEQHSDLHFHVFNSKYVCLTGLRSLTVYVEGDVTSTDRPLDDVKNRIPLKFCSASLEEFTLLSRKDQLRPFLFLLIEFSRV